MHSVWMGQGDPPVDVTSPEAKRLLEDELSDPEYDDPFDLAYELEKLLADFLSDMGMSEFSASVLSVIVVVLAVAGIVFAMSRLAWRKNAHTEDQVAAATAGSAMGLSEIVGKAEAAEKVENYHDAVMWWFRALARVGVRDDGVRGQASLTATEVALAVGALYPAVQTEATGAADTFNLVAYGHRDATAAHAAQVRGAFGDVREAVTTAPSGGATVTAVAGNYAPPTPPVGAP